ncbi:MAG: hypothetical protein GY767_14010 [Shimia sp.]|nr:hypothetical protein [Shimia sp.]
MLQYGYPDFTPLPAIDIIGTLPLAQFGAPDFTIDTGETGLSLSGSDLELGRRLNWPTAWTRIGKVFFHDSPDSSTPHMELASVGAGASATVDNTRANSKSYSYKLTTGAGVGHTASVYRDFPGTPSMKIGFGLWFWYDGTDDHISFTIRHLSGTELTVLGLVFYPASKEWFYLDNAGVEQTLGTLSPDPTQLLGWHFIQLVVDLTAQAYVRVVAGTTLQVLTASGQVTPDATTGPELRIITTIRDDVGVGMDWWVDDIILTYDEL